jgi:hypothetical protein
VSVYDMKERYKGRVRMGVELPLSVLSPPTKG